MSFLRTLEILSWDFTNGTLASVLKNDISYRFPTDFLHSPSQLFFFTMPCRFVSHQDFL